MHINKCTFVTKAIKLLHVKFGSLKLSYLSRVFFKKQRNIIRKIYTGNDITVMNAKRGNTNYQCLYLRYYVYLIYTRAVHVSSLIKYILLNYVRILPQFY